MTGSITVGLKVILAKLMFLSYLLKVENLKKAIKASSQSDIDNGAVSGMPPPYHSQQYQQKALTSTKTKGSVFLF